MPRVGVATVGWLEDGAWSGQGVGACGWERERLGGGGGGDEGVVVCCLLNVPTTGEFISGTDLLKQFYVLPH